MLSPRSASASARASCSWKPCWPCACAAGSLRCPERGCLFDVLAVAAATRRDVGAVLKCEDTVDQILGRVLVLPGLPGAMLKKTEVAKATLRKLDNMLYELSLSRKSSSTEPDAGVGGDAGKGGGGSAGGLGASGPGET